jgi:2-hydroxy-3-keto-5-methylthiopentenyl-1-phosphate phosphatase
VKQVLWYHPAPVTRYLIACDFDGTITRRDTLHLVVDHYGDRSMWDRLDGPLRRGEMTVEEAMQREFATVRATPAQVLELVSREAGVRDGFAEFAAWAERGGHRLVVMSNGFRTVIDHVLGGLALGHLPVVSHDAAFDPEGTRLLWSDRGERCGLCGRPCKRSELAAVRGEDTVVYLGDGISDRCVSGAADVLFARSGLAEWLGEQGRAFHPFEDFHSVMRDLDGLLEVAA